MGSDAVGRRRECGSLHDPTLPFSESEALVTALNKGPCLAVYDGDGHVAVGNRDIEAIGWAVAFIRDLELPCD